MFGNIIYRGSWLTCSVNSISIIIFDKRLHILNTYVGHNILTIIIISCTICNYMEAF